MRKKLKKINGILYLPFLTAILLGLVFISKNLYWISLIGLIPLILFCERAHLFSQKQILRSVYWSGFMYLLFVFVWILQTTPNSWTEIGGIFAVLIKVSIWLLCALFMSVGFYALGKYINYFKTKPQTLIFSLPAVWALAEFVRVYLFSIFYYGPGGSISPNWNLGIIGLGATNSPLVYSSRFVGLYGLSIVVVLINIALYFLIYKKNIKYSVLIVMPIIILGAVGYVMYRPSQKTIEVGAVHLASEDSLNDWGAIEYPPKDLDLLVLPEYSLYFDNKDYQKFSEENIGKNTTIITSVSGDGVPATNNLTFYDSTQGIYSSQPKTFLIGTGEYVPYFITGFFKLINQEGIIKSFNETQQVKRGPTPEHAVQTPSAKVGALVCSGVLALNEYRRLSSEGAEILTNSASLALISQASLYHVQEGYLTKFHAVANAKPFAQSSRSGESYILNWDGSRLVSTTGDSTLISSNVQTSSSRTLYSILGEWTILASAAIIIFIAYVKRKEN